MLQESLVLSCWGAWRLSTMSRHPQAMLRLVLLFTATLGFVLAFAPLRPSARSPLAHHRAAAPLRRGGVGGGARPCRRRAGRGAATTRMSLDEFRDELARTAAKLATPGKGLLVLDESPGSMEARLGLYGLENSGEMRQAYRTMLCTTGAMSDYLAGVALEEGAFIAPPPPLLQPSGMCAAASTWEQWREPSARLKSKYLSRIGG